MQALAGLETDYWYEVDHNWGRAAHEFYVADGTFAIGDKVMSGREAIAGFYRWRESRGDRTARHVVTNFRLLSHTGDAATFACIMLLYAADGLPVLPSLPAIMIADAVGACRRDAEGRWRFASHRLIPVFESGAPATLPPEA
ncbi:MAG: nuclear transport factor 2 family protein [Pseudorhodoplanes sp.]|nr:nuclear transport factor 2 family protein [Pseudorhodoplanes sp.]